MSIIQSLTQNQPSSTRQLILSSTLPKKIDKILSLERFTSLRTLNLSNNCINKIENISHLRNLKILNLQFNQLTQVENIQGLNSLEQLFLSYNSIQYISPRIQLNLKLKVLSIGYNQLKNMESVMPIFSLQKLVVLALHGNPFLNTLNYMVFIKMLLPGLKYLDQKDLNVTNLEGQLYPQEEVAILRETLNELLKERNYLAEQLQKLMDTSSPSKIYLREYLKQHRKCNIDEEGNSSSNSNPTFSPQKLGPIEFKRHSLQNQKFKIAVNEDESSIKSQKPKPQPHVTKQPTQRQKMLQILRYWLRKTQQKTSSKNKQVSQLHQYYTDKLKQKRSFIQHSQQQQQVMGRQSQHVKQYGWGQEQGGEIGRPRLERGRSSRLILKEIRQKQAELSCNRNDSKAIKILIRQVEHLQPNQQMYKILMMRILFGSGQAQVGKSQAQGKQSVGTKRQLNYKQLKHFLLSQYGLLNALNDMNRLVFGVGQFSVGKVGQLESWTKGKSLLEIVNEAKSQMKVFKREQKAFESQKQQYLQKLQQQTKQLYSQWSQFNQTKQQFQFQKCKQFRHQQKMLQQKQNQLQDKFQQLNQTQKMKLLELNEEKQQMEKGILELELKHEELEFRYERKYGQLEEFQKQFNSFREEKENMMRMQEQVKTIKRELVQKESLINETSQKLKQLSLSEEISSERVKFLERKCYQKAQQVRALDEEEKRFTERLRRLAQEQRLRGIEICTGKQRFSVLSQEEKTTLKSIQRHKNNLCLYQQKLKNLSQLQSHKKKSLQQIQFRIQQQKSQFILLNQKNLQLEEILAQKEQNIHSYQLRIAEHKKSLEAVADISRNVQDLMARQSELKKSILELEIQNGNLIDLKGQMIRELRQTQNSVLFNRAEWNM